MLIFMSDATSAVLAEFNGAPSAVDGATDALDHSANASHANRSL